MSYPFAGQGFVNVTAAGTPVALASSTLLCKNFTVQAYKSLTAGPPPVLNSNTGAQMFLYDNSSPKKLLFAIASGQSFSPGIQGSSSYDLSQIFLDASANGDGVLLTVS